MASQQGRRRVEAIAQYEGLACIEGPYAQVRIRTVRVALVDRPVEAVHAVVALDAGALDHNVVAVFTVVVGIVALTIQDVMTYDR